MRLSTIESDANAFAAKFGLPKLTASNFQIIYTPTPSERKEDQAEINLDVEWAHAIAPGADIALIVPPSDSLQDVDEAEFYAVNTGSGTRYPAASAHRNPRPSLLLDTENLIAEIAALTGISTNSPRETTAIRPGPVGANGDAPADRRATRGRVVGTGEREGGKKREEGEEGEEGEGREKEKGTSCRGRCGAFRTSPGSRIRSPA